MGTVRRLRPLGRPLAALEEEGIGCILIGMAAAITQGVMGSTLDVGFPSLSAGLKIKAGVGALHPLNPSGKGAEQGAP